MELPEGPISTSYNLAANEALDSRNSLGERLLFGALGLLAGPAAGLEQAARGFLGTPERLNRNVPAVVNETKRAIAAKDTDTRLRHGAAALGAGSSVVLDVTVVAGLAKAAATATMQSGLTGAASGEAASSVQGGSPSAARPRADYTNPAVVEAQVRQNAANSLARAERQGLSGAAGGNVADRTFNRLNAAFEKRLQSAGSPYGIDVQPARNAAGIPVPARTNGAYTAGSKRLDATIFDRTSGQIFSGFDITISTTRWNRAADNAAYMQRFVLSHVEEINPLGPR